MKREKDVKTIVRENMTEADACCYVPVQKLTIAIALLGLSKMCANCDSEDCTDCTIEDVTNKLAEAIGCRAMFDEEFNLLPPPCESEGEARNEN